VTHKDGSAVETELTAFALRAGGNELTGYLAIHRDLGERRRAEEALRAANLRAETILESITDAFVAVDHEWRYTYVNDLGLRRMQDKKCRSLTRADVLGKHMWDLFPDFVGTEIFDSYQEAMRERRPVSLQTYFERTEEWLEAHIYPSDTGLAIYYHNVSDRHLAEQARREARRQADRREVERDRIDRATVETITPREREILQLLADGLGSRAIADRLNITVRTQRNHMTNILSKLGVHSQLQALVFALRYEVVAIR
jgi:DNA-binding CsgD family transcriptional regulator